MKNKTAKIKKLTIALVGNQNSGKTSLFNRLVGARQKVGNWPGVTVEKYIGKIKYQNIEMSFVDLPGIYSLIPYTPEEKIALDYLLNNKPDVILNVVDATNLNRNLYLSTQLLELQRPLVLALNVIDETEKLGIKINYVGLSELFGVAAQPCSARTGYGLAKLLDLVIQCHQHNTGLPCAQHKLEHYPDVEEELAKLTELICQDQEISEEYAPKWLALKLLEEDKNIFQLLSKRPVWLELEPVLRKSLKKLEKHFEQDLRTTLVESRYAFIRGALQETVSYLPKNKKNITELIDDVLINRVVGLPIFFFVLWLIFQSTFSLGQIPMAWLELGFNKLSLFLQNILPNNLFKSLLIDGVVSGVGSVLVFVPNILILFFGISLLEATGYLARAAFVVDRAMHKIGLHGRSFIPMLLGFGCSVPAFMACRTLKNRSDRITTMLVIPFISCSAKLPVYVLLISAFFKPAQAGNILFGIYMFGVLIALLMARILKKVVFQDDSEPFVMELPPYRLPSLKNLLIHTWEKVWMYLRKAGTILLGFAVLIWLISNFPVNMAVEKDYQTKIQLIQLGRTFSERQKETQISELSQVRAAAQLEYSIAGRAGKIIEPLIKPLGFNWKIGIALIAGFSAKEVVVSTLGTIYSLGEEHRSTTTNKLVGALRQSPDFNPLVALSLMIFVLLYVPCMAATAVFHKEAGSWRWTWFYIFYTTGTAYLLSLLVYQLGKIFFKL